MEHVVFFPAHDGTPAFRRVANLEDAVRLVEHLRNVEGTNEVSVHALAEVPLSFRTVIKVEVPGAVDTAPLVPAQPAVEADAAADAPVAEVEAVVEPVVVEPDVAAPVLEVVPDAAPEPELATASNGSAKSLGFFS